MLDRAHKKLIDSLFSRHGRKKSDLCVCEGIRAVTELFAASPERVEFVVASFPPPFDCGKPVFSVDLEEYRKLSGTVTGQGILAVAKTPEYAGDDAPCRDRFVLALDRIADPGNFGTICRTARAAGLTELWLTEGTTDPFSAKSIRAGMGSQFSMKFRKFSGLEEMRLFGKQRNYGTMYLSVVSGGENCFTAGELYDHSILVVGNEANGVELIPEGRKISIPMPGGFESLNAAQAATILIFESVRRKYDDHKQRRRG